MRRHVLRFFALVIVALVVIALAAGGYARVVLRRSLPLMDGTRVLSGLAGPVTITRDSLGVPTIAAGSRADLARAVGFVHAQERFFQMDLQRRQPSGELSAIVGSATIAADRTMRVHRFRHIAQQALALAPADYRAELDAYAAGVNAGLAALAAPPFEYLMLRTTPEPWRAEDSMLVAIAMYVTLQGSQWEYEQTLGALHELPAPMFEFLAGRASSWESPIVGAPQPVPPVPGADVFDIRSGTTYPGPTSGVSGHTSQRSNIDDPNRLAQRESMPALGGSLPWWMRLPHADEATLGSNNWAVSGARSRTGSAIVSNDMHLRLTVPNIWFRAAYEYPDERMPGKTRRLVGVTLPGGPQMAVGSNGDIAWGFTNSVGDWSDLVLIEPAPRDPAKYQTPEGPRAFDVYPESIAVKGAAPVTIDARWTIWGPVIGRDHRGREQVLKWVAHDPRVLSTDAARISHARDVDEAMQLSVGAALAAENVVVGDRAGRIAWTIYGAIPNRVGFSSEGRAPGSAATVPTSWADGSHRWDGYLDVADHPRVVDPPDGQLWTANARVAGGEMADKIGDGGYSEGIRAWMIRQDLQALETADERALFDVQLDNRSIFLDRWRDVFLKTLTADAARATPERTAARQLVEAAWTGRASADSVAYRIVRTFRLTTSRMAFDALTAQVRTAAPDFDYGTVRRVEGPLWRLVDERPLHLLDPAYATWDAFLLAAIDRTLATMTSGGRPLAERTWGEANAADIAHPLASALPWLARWLRMPADPLSGDVYTPRVLAPRSGASERLVVSPGHEATGILHMPGGQSGHPLSPHFGDQQRAWIDGTPLPLLPGASVHSLTLTP